MHFGHRENYTFCFVPLRKGVSHIEREILSAEGVPGRAGAPRGVGGAGEGASEFFRCLGRLGRAE